MKFELPSEENSAEDRQGATNACPSFETLSRYFDRELSEPERGAVSSHIETCDACSLIIRDFDSLRRSLRATTPVTASTRSFVLSPQMAAAPLETTRAKRSASRAPARLYPLPVLAIIAATLLLVFIAGDLAARRQIGSGPTPESANVIMIDGTPFQATNEDRDANVNAAANDTLNSGSTSADADTGSSTAANQPGATSGEDVTPLWRIGAALCIAALLVLLALMTMRLWSRRA